MAAGWLTGCGAAQADGGGPPLRIVRAGLPDVAGLRKFIEVSHEGCLAAKGLPPSPAPTVADAVLSKLQVHEEEELFDGKRWAKYEVYRAVGADAASQCKLMVFHSRSVQIEVTCESSIEGTGATLTELMDPQSGPAPKPDLQERKGGSPECDAPREAHDITGLPTADAGQGTQCVWNNDLVARTAGVKAGGDPGSYDMCLYSKRPFYYVKGHGRPVVLKSRSDDRSQTGAYLPTFVGQIAGFGNVKLVSIADGAGISAERFSRAAAENFLRQPMKTAIGGQ